MEKILIVYCASRSRWLRQNIVIDMEPIDRPPNVLAITDVLMDWRTECIGVNKPIINCA
jgi:hypothetical protein